MNTQTNTNNTAVFTLQTTTDGNVVVVSSYEGGNPNIVALPQHLSNALKGAMLDGKVTVSVSTRK